MFTNGSYNLARAETASDTTDFFYGVCDALYVGVTGNVTVVLDSNATVLFPAVPAGAVLPINAKRVNNTATAASGFVALYRK